MRAHAACADRARTSSASTAGPARGCCAVPRCPRRRGRPPCGSAGACCRYRKARRRWPAPGSGRWRAVCGHWQTDLPSWRSRRRSAMRQRWRIAGRDEASSATSVGLRWTASPVTREDGRVRQIGRGACSRPSPGMPKELFGGGECAISCEATRRGCVPDAPGRPRPAGASRPCRARSSSARHWAARSRAAATEACRWPGGARRRVRRRE